MKVTVASKENETVVLEALATADEIERAFEAAYMSFAQKMGLQPDGQKSIAQIAEEKLGIKDLDSVVEPSVAEYLIPFAVDKKNLVPAFPAKVIKKALARRGHDFAFTVEVTLKSELELASYDPVTIHIPPFSIDETEIDNQIKQMAESYSDFVVIEPRPARLSDSVLLNITARKNGQDVQSLTTENAIYTLGSHQLGAEFDNQVVGMSASDEKEFPLEYDGPETTLDDRTIECIVELLEVREKVVPPINDEWIMQNIPAAKTLTGFRNLIKEEFTRSYNGEYEAMKRQLATTELAKRYKGSLSNDAMLLMQQTIVNNLNTQLQKEGSSLQEHIEKCGGEQQFNLATMMQSKETLSQGYALDALYLHEKMSLTEQDIIEACKSFDLENPEMIRKQMELSGCGYMLRETAERLKASNWLVDHAEIIEETYQESS